MEMLKNVLVIAKSVYSLFIYLNEIHEYLYGNHMVILTAEGRVV